MNENTGIALGRGHGKSSGQLEAALKEFWNNASEDVKNRLLEQQNQKVSVSSRGAHSGEFFITNFFNTLKENQCNEFCQSGKCKADCCGCVNILEAHFKLLKKFIPDNKEYFPVKLKENGFTYIKPMTKNFKCVFLTDSNSCAIYGSHLRPSYCKRFGEDAKEPLYACIHINEEMKSEIEEFSKIYLQQQADLNNPIAKKLLSQEKEEN